MMTEVIQKHYLVKGKRDTIGFHLKTIFLSKERAIKGIQYNADENYAQEVYHFDKETYVTKDNRTVYQIHPVVLEGE